MTRTEKNYKNVKKILDSHNAKYSLEHQGNGWFEFIVNTSWGRWLVGMSITPRRKVSMAFMNFRDDVPTKDELPGVPINRFNGKLNIFESDEKCWAMIDAACYQVLEV